ncbi:calcium-dependent lipid-binding family protein [Striga asiatica]|uniref:Calcium-dependent lipid-binding family protein n=1 Tax=Striga asiatica TaxID=4170 RepID=A0A5A7PYU0_STRAF|nr:calcium-dependent lipid-binding family protein [Striga asiatica]
MNKSQFCHCSTDIISPDSYHEHRACFLIWGLNFCGLQCLFNKEILRLKILKRALIDSTAEAGFCCLYDLLRRETSSNWGQDSGEWKDYNSCPRERLESLLTEAGNKFCADCGSPDPKWVFTEIPIMVLSVKLDEWSHEEVDALIEMGGNTAVNLKYEAHIPDNMKKPKPDSSAEERTDFIRRKYELHQFSNCDLTLACPFPSPLSSSNCTSSGCSSQSAPEKKHYEKQTTGHRKQGLGHAFRNSWRRTEHRTAKKTNSMAGMVEFVGLIKVNIVRGTNLAIRDMVTSDPYVILTLGSQSMKTRVIKNNLNPVWNESLMLSIPESIPPLKLLVYDKDTFSTDDFMGNAEIDIQPLLSAAKASESSSINESTLLGKWKAGQDNTLVKDGVIILEDGRVKQEISIKLQNVERGVLEIELECVPLTQ